MHSLSTAPSVATYLFLALGILSLWLTPNPRVWLSLGALAIAFGIASGRVLALGVCAAVLLCLACFLYFRRRLRPGAKIAVGFVILLVSLLLGTHTLPGFKNWLILSGISLSPDAIPMNLYLNFDKALVGLFLIGWGYKPIQTLKEWRAMLAKTAPILLMTVAVLLGLCLGSGYVKVDFKWVEFSGLWLIVNLIFACVAEEALFRGFLQERLSAVLKPWKNGSILALLLTSILFGLAHFKGGTTLIVFATLAGIFYGLAYLRTKRLEASILTHFAVNAIHFLAFTYPALRR